MARKATLQPIPETSNQDILAIALGALLLLTPLLSTGIAIFSGAYDQNMWVMGVSFAFGAILLVRYFFSPQKSQINFRWLDVLVLVWFLWLIITTFTSYNIIDSVVGVLARTGSLLHWLALVLIYFAIRSLVLTSSRLWSYAQVGIILSGTATALVGLLKLLLSTQEGNQLLGILGNQNFTAYFLAVTTIVTYTYWLVREKRVFNWTLLALVIQAAALWMASAKWVYGVLLIAAIAIHLIMANRGQIDRVKNTVLLIGWIVLIGLGTGSYLLKGNMSFDPSLAVLKNRFAAWEMAWEASFDKPIFGWGLENYDNSFQAHFQPRFESSTGQTETFDRPHNFILLHLVTTGWIGLILFLSILGTALYSGFKNLKSPPAVWATAVVATYVGINLLGFETIAATAVLVMALAYLGSLSPPFKTFTPSAWWSYLSAGGAVVLAVWLIYFVVAPWVGSQIAWRAIAKLNLEGYHQALSYAPYLRPNLAYYLLTDAYKPKEHAGPEFYNKLAPYLQENAVHRINEPGYSLAIAKAWELSNSPQKHQKIKEALTKGLALYDNKNGYYWAFYANNELFLGNIDGALEALAKAKALNPDSVFTKEAEEEVLKGIEIIRGREGEES